MRTMTSHCPSLCMSKNLQKVYVLKGNGDLSGESNKKRIAHLSLNSITRDAAVCVRIAEKDVFQ